MSAPAGWYDDGSGRQRWWDGSQWTENYYVAQADAVTSAQPQVIDTSSAAEVAPVAAPAPFVPPYVIAANTTAPVQHPSAAPAYPGYAQPYPMAPPKPGFPVLGIIGLSVVGLGILLSCIPVIAAAGWAALIIGLVLSVVSLFMRGAKWPGFLGIGGAGLGAILAVAVALIAFTAPAQNDAPTASTSGSEDPTPLDDDSPSTIPTDPSEIDGAVMTTFADLEVGDCIPLIDYGDDLIYDLPVVPCDSPHTDEVYFIFDVEDGDFPGDDAMQETATAGCLAEFETFVGIAYEDSELDFYTYQPTRSSWNRWGDRTVLCIVYSFDDVTGTLAGSAY